MVPVMTDASHHIVWEIKYKVLHILTKATTTELKPGANIHWFCLSGIHVLSMMTATVVVTGETILFHCQFRSRARWHGTFPPLLLVWMMKGLAKNSYITAMQPTLGR